jgi:hypothetical protein
MAGALVEPAGIELGQVDDQGRHRFPFAAGKAGELDGERVVRKRGRVHHHNDDCATLAGQGRTKANKQLSNRLKRHPS